VNTRVPPDASGARGRRYRGVRRPDVCGIEAWRFSVEARVASDEDGDQTIDLKGVGLTEDFPKRLLE
jgi:hypothetical protein